tara:strand:+ start:1283 stop:1609 length:327 start_codon:yes stop_codon:yes gene_type:complete
MAQDFESTGGQITNTATTLLTANSDDAIVGLRLANVLTSAVTVSVWISENGSTDRYLVKNLSLPAASSVELIQSGSKVVMQNTDVLKGQSDTASSVDVWISRVDSIST